MIYFQLRINKKYSIELLSKSELENEQLKHSIKELDEKFHDMKEDMRLNSDHYKGMERNYQEKIRMLNERLEQASLNKRSFQSHAEDPAGEFKNQNFFLSSVRIWGNNLFDEF